MEDLITLSARPSTQPDVVEFYIHFNSDNEEPITVDWTIEPPDHVSVTPAGTSLKGKLTIHNPGEYIASRFLRIRSLGGRVEREIVVSGTVSGAATSTCGSQRAISQLLSEHVSRRR